MFSRRKLVTLWTPLAIILVSVITTLSSLYRTYPEASHTPFHRAPPQFSQGTYHLWKKGPTENHLPWPKLDVVVRSTSLVGRIKAEASKDMISEYLEGYGWMAGVGTTQIQRLPQWDPLTMHIFDRCKITIDIQVIGNQIISGECVRIPPNGYYPQVSKAIIHVRSEGQSLLMSLQEIMKQLNIPREEVLQRL